MIRRWHEYGVTRSEALYSDCGRYRYALARSWGTGGVLSWVMLNPSTATETHNDATVARCEGRARAMGFGGVRIANLFAFRATVPRDLWAADDPVGSGNDAAILACVAGAALLVCAWGRHGSRMDRAATVEQMLRRDGFPLWHLGLCKSGEPRHPLYVRAERALTPWA